MPRSPQPAPPAAVTDLVIEWFATQGRDLPWRAPEATPWGVLVSEVMLQQTPVARVEPVWRTWLERWPIPADLAQASQADAVRAWGRLGYPRRAMRLWECARTLVAHHAGEVPRSEAALLALPGVGEYTAAAVLAFAFGERTVVLDTNVRRVIGRVWRGEAMPTPHLTRAEREQAGELVPHERATAASWNAAAMELGALVCVARAPRCEVCPVATHCTWFAAGKPGLDDAPARSQAWHGTDRQVRGKVLALLRAASAPINVTGHASVADVDPGQLDRCLESLVTDGLITLTDGGRGTYTL
ncbi:MAG: adenine glycosylase [Actinobacteria bacterium HGW-Actinobacteria-4]|nr:MAG: adenine glycosylase [Actinobacteria bacterium HGW-Actinobacteria-4]